MFTDLKNIAPLIENQFPSFYKEEGENFIQFIKAYYEWMDSEASVGYKTRRLGEYRDIDQTLDEYVKYFMTKYMDGIPKNILTDKRFLEKHILDVYRSKGASEGMKLLFRLLYNKNIEIYLPQIDILKPSSGKWYQRKYIEVIPKNSTNHFSYLNKFITGTTTGAIAYVDEAVELYIGDKICYILFITDLHYGKNGDEFGIGEYLTYDGFTTLSNTSYVLGSARSATVDSSGADNAINDVLVVNTDSAKGLQFNVKALLDYGKNIGYITFKIVDGGYGYRANSPISIGYRTATMGSGASFKIKTIRNTSVISINSNLLSDSAATLLSAADYGSVLNNTNVNSVLQEALTFDDITIGTISEIHATTSGDRKYNGSLQVSVTEPLITGYGYTDSKGGIWGNNAVITAELAAANGTVGDVKLLSSGFGFNTQGESLTFSNPRNQDTEVQLTINVAGVGMEEGRWSDNTGLLNTDKYIQDSYYYQDYSYEIQVEKSLDKYVDVVKKVMHPVGNMMFGKPLIISDNNFNLNLETDLFSVLYS